jgi:ABC-2 type transport system ATP-binding protein
MIKIENLQKSYGGTEVLNVPILQVEKGEILGVVGNNGAGKTTLFSLILDLIKADAGSVELNGSDVSREEGWKTYTSAFLDDSFLINFLTPEEYFEFVGSLHNTPKSDVQAFVQSFEQVFNGEVLNKKKYIRELSLGNRKKVGLVGSLIGNPELVLWDEPFNSLDPSTQMRVRNLIADNARKTTFLISSHDLHHIAEICSRILILEKGNILKDVQRSETTRDELFEFFEVKS